MPIQVVADASTWTQKMLDRVSGSGDAWLRGVQNPRQSPTAAMKAANGKWKNNTQAAITGDRWGKRVATLTDESIQAAAAAAGSSKFIAGVQQRKDKIAAAIQRLQPKVANLAQQVRSMPQDNDQQREARMIANLRGMRAIKGS